MSTTRRLREVGMAGLEQDILAADAETLHKMGYAQELSHRMGGFSNFAVAFWIICILPAVSHLFMCASVSGAPSRPSLDGSSAYRRQAMTEPG